MTIKTYKQYTKAGWPGFDNFLKIGDFVDYEMACEIVGDPEIVDTGLPVIQSKNAYDILGGAGVAFTLQRYCPNSDPARRGLEPYVYAGLCEMKSPEEYMKDPGCLNGHPRSAQKVYVCSPYRGNGDGDIQFHESFAAAICRFLWNTRGVLPIATHLFFPRFLDDKDPRQRDWALEAGRMAIEECDYVYCAALAAPPSDGMAQEMEHAAARGILVEYCYYTVDSAKVMIESYLKDSEK